MRLVQTRPSSKLEKHEFLVVSNQRSGMWSVQRFVHSIMKLLLRIQRRKLLRGRAYPTKGRAPSLSLADLRTKGSIQKPQSRLEAFEDEKVRLFRHRFPRIPLRLDNLQVLLEARGYLNRDTLCDTLTSVLLRLQGLREPQQSCKSSKTIVLGLWNVKRSSIRSRSVHQSNCRRIWQREP
jgi:hypothetical protein